LTRATTPLAWWTAFSSQFLPSVNSPTEILDALSKAVQRFPVDGHRSDPHLLRIWLAFLEAHFTLHGDREECGGLFKFLKSEHVGGAALAELYLHWAKFELVQGKVEKALGVLQAGLESSSTLQRSPQLLSAIELLKLTGKLNVPSVLNMPLAKKEPQVQKGSQETLVDEALQYSQLRRESLVSVSSVAVPRISPSEGPPSALSSVSRLRRVGLGPPKRATVPPLSPINDDSTVPKTSAGGLTSSNTSIGGGSGSSGRNSLGRVDAEYSTPPRQRTRSKLTGHEMSVDASPLSNLSRSRLNYTDAPLLVDDDEDEDEDDEMERVMVNLSQSSIAPSKALPSSQPAAAKPASSAPEQVVKTRAVKINGKTYRVLHLIGRGGSSKVFKVLAPDNQVLALKRVCLRNLDEATLSGYVNEIGLLRSLGDEEHIIRLVDSELNRAQGSLFILMEYGEIDLGQMLRQRANGTPLDLNFIRYCWQQMLRAVQQVHAAKVVHCDLKPANFLLVRGRLKLIDFGISKAILNDTTNIVRENQVGTVNYMSPEALQESSGASAKSGIIKIGRPSDVWSLGCILYEMAYGRPPFAAYSLVQRLQRIMDPAHQIEFGQLPDPSLLSAIKGCLTRSIRARHRPAPRAPLPDAPPHHRRGRGSGVGEQGADCGAADKVRRGPSGHRPAGLGPAHLLPVAAPTVD
jgi:serine/threonine-protein kinase TTK/MPS1